MSINPITIVTSCRGYGKYLKGWAQSIAALRVKPTRVVIFTHGSADDAHAAVAAYHDILDPANIITRVIHSDEALDFGTARNRAVELSETPWVMHLDADDTLMPHALADFDEIAPTADVVSFGYVLSGRISGTTSRADRVYPAANGEEALALRAICSGVSPFRRTFWEQSPYRTDMDGAWDTALWIRFAQLGARFRPTKRAVFTYHQHDDSIFNQRRRVLGWTRVKTTAQLNALRRQDAGVAVIVPLSKTLSPERTKVLARVRAHYTTHHPEWPIIEGYCSTPIWIKGAAINDALARTSADVLVIADADCIVDPSALRQSVDRVLKGASWGMPHREVYRADLQMTERYCASSADMSPTLPDRHSVARAPYVGAEGGGLVVIRRVWFEAIGGIPTAFRGWGSEDRALACLANTLLGPCDRGDEDLLHLWHGPQVGQTSSIAAVNLQLLRRLGVAAQIGKDALVATVYTLVQPGGGSQAPEPRSNSGTARPSSVIGLFTQQNTLAHRRHP